MYQTPKLNRIGQAVDVVLGMAFDGWDLDGTWVGSSGGMEFAEDPEPGADSQ